MPRLTLDATSRRSFSPLLVLLDPSPSQSGPQLETRRRIPAAPTAAQGARPAQLFGAGNLDDITFPKANLRRCVRPQPVALAKSLRISSDGRRGGQGASEVSSRGGLASWASWAGGERTQTLRATSEGHGFLAGCNARSDAIAQPM